MPKKAKALSAVEVNRLVHPGRGGNAVFAVGGVDGLLLQIAPSGARSWVLRARVAGKRRHLGLGSFPLTSLAVARERARDARAAIFAGVDPVAERAAQRRALQVERRRGLTFANAIDHALEGRLAEFRSEKHKRQWRSTLDTYAAPVLGDMLVGDIAVQDVARVLAPIWSTKTETASRLRGRIEAVLAWATVSGHREGDNPARWKGNLDAILPRPGKIAKVAHHPAVKLADAPRWFADVRHRDGMATRALEFMALTAARSGEVRGATWEEIDLDTGLWIIPAARMKAGRDHRVPLSEAARALLDDLPRMVGEIHVFAAPRGGALSDMALSACMRRINAAAGGGYLDARSGRPAVPHGLRSTFRDWCAERGADRDMAEIALAHSVGSTVERAYRRSDMLERRRALMEAWAMCLEGAVGNVVSLDAGRG